MTLAAVAVLVADCGGGNARSGPTVPTGDATPAVQAPFDFGGNDPFRVTAFGDSITLGVLEDSVIASRPYPSQLQTMLRGLDARYRVINRGLGGEDTARGLARLPGVLARDRPGYVLILEGTNDATFGESPAVIVANLRQMLEIARRNRTVPVLGTIPPNFRRDPRPGQTVQEANPMIRALAREEGVVLAEVFDGMNDRSLFGADGLHPTERGYGVMAGIWYEAMRRAIRPPAPGPSVATATAQAWRR